MGIYINSTFVHLPSRKLIEFYVKPIETWHVSYTLLKKTKKKYQNKKKKTKKLLLLFLFKKMQKGSARATILASGWTTQGPILGGWTTPSVLRLFDYLKWQNRGGQNHSEDFVVMPPRKTWNSITFDWFDVSSFDWFNEKKFLMTDGRMYYLIICV